MTKLVLVEKNRYTAFDGNKRVCAVETLDGGMSKEFLEAFRTNPNAVYDEVAVDEEPECRA